MSSYWLNEFSNIQSVQTELAHVALNCLVMADCKAVVKLGISSDLTSTTVVIRHRNIILHQKNARLLRNIIVTIQRSTLEKTKKVDTGEMLAHTARIKVCHAHSRMN
jgi:hypothetical protein